jgi:DnaA family protein
MNPGSLLEGLDDLDWLCIDGLQFVAANSAWELALFALFNALRDKGGRLLIAANASPNKLPIALPDLQSRLNWGLALSIQPLSDEEKLAALQLRAKARGLDLSDEVGQYILHRAPRDMGPLFQCLNTLDKASLAEQRRLTIPFVKQVLGF